MGLFVAGRLPHRAFEFGLCFFQTVAGKVGLAEFDPALRHAGSISTACR